MFSSLPLKREAQTDFDRNAAQRSTILSCAYRSSSWKLRIWDQCSSLGMRDNFQLLTKNFNQFFPKSKPNTESQRNIDINDEELSINYIFESNQKLLNDNTNKTFNLNETQS
jgi:hypothetical protein